MKIILIASLLFVLSTAAFGQAKTDGKAIVYIYSYATTTTLGQVRKPVFLDEKEISDIRPEHFFIALIDPGKHIFSLKNKKFGGIERQFDAGQTYYIRIDWRNNGLELVPQGFVSVPAENGAYDVKQLKPVDKKNIKDPAIVVLALN